MNLIRIVALHIRFSASGYAPGYDLYNYERASVTTLEAVAVSIFLACMVAVK